MVGCDTLVNVSMTMESRLEVPFYPIIGQSNESWIGWMLNKKLHIPLGHMQKKKRRRFQWDK